LTADDDAAFQGSDTTSKNNFRKRVGSIVRLCSVSSNAGLCKYTVTQCKQ